MHEVDKKLELQKNQLINNILVVFSGLATILLAVSLYRITDFGWHPTMGFHAFLLGLIYIVAYIRKSLSTKIKISFILFVFYSVALAGLTTYGVLAGSQILFLVAPVIATAIVNLRLGFIIIGMSTIAIAVVGTLIVQGKWNYDFDVLRFASSTSIWLALIAAYLCLSIIAVLVISNVQKNIYQNLATIEKQRKELNQLNISKDKLFSVIAHDLRNPLKGLSTYLTLLSEGEIELSKEEKEQIFKTLLKESSNTAALLDNLLTWASAQIGAIKIEKTHLNVNDTCYESVVALKGLANEKRQALEIKVPKELTLFGDESSLKIVIGNLVSNAIKFTPENGKITVSAEKNKDDTIISVTDTGIGMKSDVFDKLFTENDFQTSYGTNNETGTGLGLNICAELMEKQGGSISAESVEGEGTTFHLSISNSFSNS